MAKIQEGTPPPKPSALEARDTGEKVADTGTRTTKADKGTTKADKSTTMEGKDTDNADKGITETGDNADNADKGTTKADKDKGSDKANQTKHTLNQKTNTTSWTHHNTTRDKHVVMYRLDKTSNTSIVTKPSGPNSVSSNAAWSMHPKIGSSRSGTDPLGMPGFSGLGSFVAPSAVSASMVWVGPKSRKHEGIPGFM